VNKIGGNQLPDGGGGASIVETGVLLNRLGRPGTYSVSAPCSRRDSEVSSRHIHVLTVAKKLPDAPIDMKESFAGHP
jgi:hypothetical protein